MRPPKKNYLELNNVPPCNFGALWYEEPVEGGVAYLLESDFKERIAELEAENVRLQSERMWIQHLAKHGLFVSADSKFWETSEQPEED